jgi:hypothetical protein
MVDAPLQIGFIRDTVFDIGGDRDRFGDEMGRDLFEVFLWWTDDELTVGRGILTALGYRFQDHTGSIVQVVIADGLILTVRIVLFEHTDTDGSVFRLYLFEVVKVDVHKDFLKIDRVVPGLDGGLVKDSFRGEMKETAPGFLTPDTISAVLGWRVEFPEVEVIDTAVGSTQTVITQDIGKDLVPGSGFQTLIYIHD